jgi:endo-1,4-beta-xylanase
MTESGKFHLTRRHFAWTALGLGATAAAGLGARTEWARDHKRRLYDAAVQPGVTGPNSLQAHAAAKSRLYGAAVVPELLDVVGVAKGHSTDAYTHLVAAQTGILVAENAMKWAALRPTADIFDFTQVDRLLRFASLLGKRVRGHNLCWYEALPGWFYSKVNKDNARQILLEHIRMVAGYTRGQIHSWDVVNEAIEPAHGLPDGLRRSPWFELIGPDYIELAFRTAAEADPQAKLTYNDYGFETGRPADTEKRVQILALLKRLKARGVPIHAVGIQSHLEAAGDQPGAGLQSFIRDVASMGLEVYVTEMDVSCKGLEGTPAEQEAVIAQFYRNYLDLVLAEPNVPIVLNWGVSNAGSWLKYSWLTDTWDRRDLWTRFQESRRQQPLLFDDNFNPSQAFWAMRAAFDAARPATSINA